MDDNKRPFPPLMCSQSPQMFSPNSRSWRKQPPNCPHTRAPFIPIKIHIHARYYTISPQLKKTGQSRPPLQKRTMQSQDATWQDPKYKCCCNKMHVERGAYIIAFVGAALSLAAVIGYIFTLNLPMVIVHAISLLIFLSIIWAQKKRNSSLYLPFLIVNGIGLLLALANLLFLICAIIVWPEFYIHYIRNTYQGNNMGGASNATIFWVLAIAILIALVTFALYAFFYYVVLRAYQYMKETQQMNVASVSVVGAGAGVVYPANVVPKV